MGRILELKIMSVEGQAVKEVNRNCSTSVRYLSRAELWELGTAVQEIADLLDNQEIWLMEGMS